MGRYAADGDAGRRVWISNPRLIQQNLPLQLIREKIDKNAQIFPEDPTKSVAH